MVNKLAWTNQYLLNVGHWVSCQHVTNSGIALPKSEQLVCRNNKTSYTFYPAKARISLTYNSRWPIHKLIHEDVCKMCWNVCRGSLTPLCESHRPTNLSLEFQSCRVDTGVWRSSQLSVNSGWETICVNVNKTRTQWFYKCHKSLFYS